jgi:hypothetical protein
MPAGVGLGEIARVVGADWKKLGADEKAAFSVQGNI